MTETVQIAVIGGSGLYHMAEITNKTALEVDTPFGKPSGKIVIGTLRGQRVAFIARHGEGHIYTPSTLPYRANIYALKSLGVRFCVSVNACGSLREDYAPGHFVIPDQLYDNTKLARGGHTFFETGLVGHVSVADPLCPHMAEILHQAAGAVENTTVHKDGTLIVIEGPRFSTRAESNAYRQLGFSIIGMTTCPEAFLAREAGIAYATVAHVTDYDVWHESEEAVSTEIVLKQVRENIERVQKIVANAVERIDTGARYDSHTAARDAVMTAAGKISAEQREKLSVIVGEYLSNV